MKTEKEIDTIECMLCDALESGYLNYWAEARNIKRNKVTGNYISFEIRDHGDSGERKNEEWVLINHAAIRKAVKKILAGEIEISRTIAAQFVGKESDWDYDAEGVDCIVQTAAFNEIVFG
jgi:hypothetical protein